MGLIEMQAGLNEERRAELVARLEAMQSLLGRRDADDWRPDLPLLARRLDLFQVLLEIESPLDELDRLAAWAREWARITAEFERVRETVESIRPRDAELADEMGQALLGLYSQIEDSEVDEVEEALEQLEGWIAQAEEQLEKDHKLVAHAEDLATTLKRSGGKLKLGSLQDRHLERVEGESGRGFLRRLRSIQNQLENGMAVRGLFIAAGVNFAEGRLDAMMDQEKISPLLLQQTRSLLEWIVAQPSFSPLEEMDSLNHLKLALLKGDLVSTEKAARDMQLSLGLVPPWGAAALPNADDIRADRARLTEESQPMDPELREDSTTPVVTLDTLRDSLVDQRGESSDVDPMEELGVTDGRLTAVLPPHPSLSGDEELELLSTMEEDEGHLPELDMLEEDDLELLENRVRRNPTLTEEEEDDLMDELTGSDWAPKKNKPAKRKLRMD